MTDAEIISTAQNCVSRNSDCENCYERYKGLCNTEECKEDLISDLLGVIERLSERISIQAADLQEKVPCEYCNDNFVFWQTEISGYIKNCAYCPKCGRKLSGREEHD